MNKMGQFMSLTQMCTLLLGYSHCTPFYSLQNCTLFSPHFSSTHHPQTHTQTQAHTRTHTGTRRRI